MSENSNNDDTDCTLAIMRRLTRPLIHAPSIDELSDVLLEPWPIRVAVSPTDYTTLNHWKQQEHTELFRQMLLWPPGEDQGEGGNDNVYDNNNNDNQNSNRPTAHLHPFFSFGDPTQPFFFEPAQDIGNCLRNLLLHQLASHQAIGHDVTLSAHGVDLFLGTGENFHKDEVSQLTISPHHYLLRCHHDRTAQELQFGYHYHTKEFASGGDTGEDCPFHKLHVVSLQDKNWRLTTCIILKNLARILLCLKDFAVPLVARPEKLSLVQQVNLDEVDDNGSHSPKRRRSNGSQYMQCIQKVYDNDYICNIFNATVSNMIDIYQAMGDAQVPYSDRVVSVVQGEVDHKRIVRFAPVGRSYLPENVQELLDALICVVKALLALGKLGIMHRDIRWANVFHALQDDGSTFSNEWYLFDFEYAAYSPQEAFPAHTLTPGNHAPEMMLHYDHTASETMEEDKPPSEPHDIAVDIWGLGYLIQHAHVDIPASLAPALLALQQECLQDHPKARPTARQCLERLEALKAKPLSICYEDYF